MNHYGFQKTGKPLIKSIYILLLSLSIDDKDKTGWGNYLGVGFSKEQWYRIKKLELDFFPCWNSRKEWLKFWKGVICKLEEMTKEH